MRRAAAVAVLVLIATDASGQIDLDEREESVREPFALDRGPLDHLGWGTLEDLYVDLGGGAAVNVFSGNLVVRVDPFPRADAVPGSRLALTYNHLDPDGSPEVAPGWSYDLGRYTAPGAWGDRVLIDGDGAADSFFAGAPPTNEEVNRVVDELVRAWRRDTPRRERRQLGGDTAMRSMLASDPLFLSEMRMRYLGPAAAPEVETGEDLIWRSADRGERALLQGDGEFLLTRADGGTERYSIEGFLTRVEPRGTPPMELTREGGRLTVVSVGLRERFRLSADSWGRLRTIRATDGPRAEFEYAGRTLWTVSAPGGDWRFTYDARGRLTTVQGPEGDVFVRYDEQTGRVAEAVGPGGAVRLGEPTGGDAVAVDVEADGIALRASWDGRARLREVTRGGGDSGDVLQIVRFAGDRPLPVEVSDEDGTVRLRWGAGGLLEEAVRDGAAAGVRWERGDGGRLTALTDASGATARMELGSDGEILGWTDPEGRTTALELDDAGRPRRLDRPGALSEAVWRTEGGLLKSVAITGGESIDLRRDVRGYVRGIESVASGSAGVTFGVRGRVERFETPGGRTLTVREGRGGAAARIEDRGAARELRFDEGRRLTGWTSKAGTWNLGRDAAGLPITLQGPGGTGWTVVRDGDGGRPASLARPDRPRATIAWDGEGRPAGWDRADGSSFRLLRDRRTGAVEGWETAGEGRVELERDRAGRVIGIARGIGRWTVVRDATGRVRQVTDPAGGTARLQLDASGRPAILDSADAHRFTLTWGESGTFQGLRDRSGPTWVLSRDRAGRPARFSDPATRTAELRYDRASRWSELKAPGLGTVEAGWEPDGSSGAGGVRVVLQPDGRMAGWGPADELGTWQVEPDASGRARGVTWRAAPGAGKARARVERPIVRDTAGRVHTTGAWKLTWTSRGLGDVLGPARTWTLTRDAAGRVRRMDAGETTVEVRHGPLGDARSLTVTGTRSEPGSEDTDPAALGAWELTRDAAGRTDGVTGAGGWTWAVDRDPTGRVRGWVVGDVQATFEPLDGSVFAGDDTIADALDVQTDDGPDEATQPPGSRRVTVEVVDGAEVLTFDELRGPAGDLAGVEGVWGSTAEPTLDESPLQPAMLEPLDVEADEDPIGGLIGALPESPPAPLKWGEGLLRSSDGEAFLPAPDGRGVGAAASSGWVRLAAHDGGTVTWIGPAGEVRALRLPSPWGDRWTSPEGWPAYPGPPGFLDPPSDASPARPPGPAAVAAAASWWRALGVGADELGRPLLAFADEVRPWLDGRRAVFAEDGRLPAAAAPFAGPGALVPPTPGARRLLPAPPGVRRTSPLSALVLSGDLPPDADAHRRFVDVPASAWTVDVPGAAHLRDVARRRVAPTEPPGWRAEALAGLAPGLDGFLTAAGAAALDAAPSGPRPAIEGLPGGTADVHPGACPEGLPGAFGSLPVHARCAALESLSDDPLVPGAARRRGIDDDALLAAIARLTPRGAGALSGWLRAPAATEAWVIETPSGTRAVVDGRGRLLAADLGGRLRRRRPPARVGRDTGPARPRGPRRPGLPPRGVRRPRVPLGPRPRRPPPPPGRRRRASLPGAAPRPRRAVRALRVAAPSVTGSGPCRRSRSSRPA